MPCCPKWKSRCFLFAWIRPGFGTITSHAALPLKRNGPRSKTGNSLDLLHTLRCTKIVMENSHPSWQIPSKWCNFHGYLGLKECTSKKVQFSLWLAVSGGKTSQVTFSTLPKLTLFEGDQLRWQHPRKAGKWEGGRSECEIGFSQRWCQNKVACFPQLQTI